MISQVHVHLFDALYEIRQINKNEGCRRVQTRWQAAAYTCLTARSSLSGLLRESRDVIALAPPSIILNNHFAAL